MGRGRDPLQVIPGVGPSLAQDLRDLGIDDPSGLEGRDPESLYQRLMVIRGHYIDRCVLYVFRCACYFAANDKHDSELLKWWNWKDA